ncbi:hypothetical protein PAMA_003858 [Pampus argenteus]
MIDEVVKLISEIVSANSHQKHNEWLNDNDGPFMDADGSTESCSTMTLRSGWEDIAARPKISINGGSTPPQQLSDRRQSGQPHGGLGAQCHHLDYWLLCRPKSSGPPQHPQPHHG